MTAKGGEEIERMLRNPHVAGLYVSQRYYGCDRILRSYLGLPEDQPLPLTIPHGIDFYRDAVVGDIHSLEPIYLALREDIAEKAASFKKILKFPHPFLLTIAEMEIPEGEGTIFIAPPPSERDFEVMHRRILEGECPRPWGILLKDRGLVRSDFDWWEARGFAVHSAGNLMNPAFFYQLRDIFARYRFVASPNMSSAVIFAVAMSRKALAIPDVPICCLEVGHLERCLDLVDREARIKRAWERLLSPDQAMARGQAEALLGKQYLSEPAVLRRRLLETIATLERPLHLYPLGGGLLYRIMLWLICRGVPAQKLFPSPLQKLSQRVFALLKINRLTVWAGSDFSHYGVAGKGERLQLKKMFAFQLRDGAKPGFALRK